MNPDPNSFVISLKLTKDQYEWLDHAARFIAAETGCTVSHSSVMMRLMEKGLPEFEREMEDLRSRNNRSSRRFHKLELVYTRVEAK